MFKKYEMLLFLITFIFGFLSPSFFVLSALEMRLTKEIPTVPSYGIKSENGNFWSETRFGKDGTIEHFALKNKNGTLLWEKWNTKENWFWISNDGKTTIGLKGAGVEGLTSYLTFYNEVGKKRREAEIKGFEGGVFASRENIFFVKTSFREIHTFNASGKELYRIKGSGSIFASSPDGRLATLEEMGEVKLYRNGVEIASVSLEEPFAYQLCFSKDGKIIACITPRNLCLFDSKKLSLVWKKHLSDPCLTYSSIDISEDEIIASGVSKDEGENAEESKRYNNGKVLLYAKDGVKVWERDVFLGGWSIHRPLVKFSPDGKILFVEGAEKTYIFEKVR
ncbi:MAG: hypothetical protein AB1393_03415 [Candidatus Edwardsbacteria bacterium]